jgi:hypothetical protein
MKGKRKAWYVVGALLLLVGIFDIGDGLFGSGRLGVGQRFYDDEKVAELVDGALAPAAVFGRACSDEKVAKRFDSRAVKKFERWCGAVKSFAKQPDAAHGVALMRANNLYFERVTDKLFLAGGELPDLALDMMTARAAFRPQMEQVGSIGAGASFSETLVGLILLVVGLFCLRRGRRQST